MATTGRPMERDETMTDPNVLVTQAVLRLLPGVEFFAMECVIGADDKHTADLRAALSKPLTEILNLAESAQRHNSKPKAKA